MSYRSLIRIALLALALGIVVSLPDLSDDNADSISFDETDADLSVTGSLFPTGVTSILSPTPELTSASKTNLGSLFPTVQKATLVVPELPDFCFRWVKDRLDRPEFMTWDQFKGQICGLDLQSIPEPPPPSSCMRDASQCLDSIKDSLAAIVETDTRCQSKVDFFNKFLANQSGISPLGSGSKGTDFYDPAMGLVQEDDAADEENDMESMIDYAKQAC
eukprot:JP446890.1.p1 GENE.JP446890.1~~JP446890.1.p1  ORF type:complete len:218 (+),score=17.80 JP446890.1:21-674(+)